MRIQSGLFNNLKITFNNIVLNCFYNNINELMNYFPSLLQKERQQVSLLYIVGKFVKDKYVVFAKCQIKKIFFFIDNVMKLR